MRRRFPPLEYRRLPVGPDEPRVLHPRPELGLRELAMLLLERDPVGVAGLQVLDQHLARDLVLATGRDLEIDLDEAVRVTVEHGRRALFLQQRDVLEPV